MRDRPAWEWPVRGRPVPSRRQARGRPRGPGGEGGTDLSTLGSFLRRRLWICERENTHIESLPAHPVVVVEQRYDDGPVGRQEEMDGGPERRDSDKIGDRGQMQDRQRRRDRGVEDRQKTDPENRH